ncbi:hypothetical protein SAMN02745163_02864 [Clostridium cavendishii DSM 21758]|uniref:Uncharacterized protein n=1 Tax=Clostridium cavendishii DSM 21758 TaxID=1121302 RepID=A0A1M6NCJ7_9CLOT|nr:hypothetical protein [Clostridium cavendishii]SHJ93407.1 hypothetical protein SAMN02745163_02864 [Clostridium cavendishii DSM 21758]
MRRSVDISNEDIKEHLLSHIKGLPNVDFKFEIDCEDKEIKYLKLDGDKEDFFICFYPWQISIFCLNEHFMFIDDSFREHNITSSDTFGEIVYEGKFKDKNSLEILEIIFNVIRIVYGANSINHEKINTDIKTISGYDTKYNYTIRIINPLYNNSIVYKLENITFYVN